MAAYKQKSCQKMDSCSEQYAPNATQKAMAGHKPGHGFLSCFTNKLSFRRLHSFWTSQTGGISWCRLTHRSLGSSIRVNRCSQSKAAGYREDLTCGVGRSIAGEIADRIRNFFRLAHAA